MLRFCKESHISQNEGLDIEVTGKYLVFDEKIWQNARKHFRDNSFQDITKLQLVPILDTRGTLVCYGWQDDEANREIRMLKELKKKPNTLQFKEIFPDIREVAVWGCNELAYYFVKYLEETGIPVTVSGQYWEYLGYKNVNNANFDGKDKMIIRAEQIFENNGNLFQKVIRSVSADFECIDKIYEANILAGNTNDTGRGLKWLFEKVKGKDIIILGTDEKAQDTYDMLYAHGIDIKHFAVKNIHENEPHTLLGKRVTTITETLHDGENVVFIEVYGKDSAWGNSYVELFDYYGYERNESFFFINDYADVPCSNLIHVLRGKSVFLTGDKRLCKIVAEYLEDVEQGDIELQYAGMLQEGMITGEDIVCTVYLWYGLNALERREQVLGEYLASVPYINYFSRVIAFAMIDQYRYRYIGKYHAKRLVPKGILINDTHSYSGNVFFKGVMDSHPDILLLQYDTFSNNLLGYCMRLSVEKSENILNMLELMLQEEFSPEEFQLAFPFWNRFERSMQRWLSVQESFTSQELFVIFHVAYTEMMYGKKITDISQKVIYFDPHWTLVEERPALAEWLDSKEINVQLVTIRRDHIKWLYSRLSYSRDILKVAELKSAYNTVTGMIWDRTDVGLEKFSFQHCGSFEVRFEDLKLHPEEEFLKICEHMEIPWSNSMLHTTVWGKMSSMGSVRDFDLKPVFNRHETEWSEFDRFRLCLVSSPYQKKYGYPCEDCMKFSRTELWEMFLREFQFQQELEFDSAKDKAAYYLWAYESIRWKLWENRKHSVMNDIKPVFESIDIGKTVKELKQEKRQIIKQEKERLARLAKNKKKLVLYGLGKDGLALWDCLDETIRLRLVFCDKKADHEAFYFHEKQVAKPKELLTKFWDYEILVTSSGFYGEICAELSDMGVDTDRIICNTVSLWEEDE